MLAATAISPPPARAETRIGSLFGSRSRAKHAPLALHPDAKIGMQKPVVTVPKPDRLAFLIAFPHAKHEKGVSLIACRPPTRQRNVREQAMNGGGGRWKLPRPSSLSYSHNARVSPPESFNKTLQHDSTPPLSSAIHPFPAAKAETTPRQPPLSVFSPT